MLTYTTLKQLLENCNYNSDIARRVLNESKMLAGYIEDLTNDCLLCGAVEYKEDIIQLTELLNNYIKKDL